MICNIGESANVMIGDASGAPDLVVWAAERMKQWFRFSRPAKLNREMSVRRDERLRERARIARDMHDTLLQGFLGVSMQMQVAVEQVSAESPVKPALDRAVLRMRHLINESREMLQGLRSSAMESMSLELALSRLREELPPRGGVQFRVFVTGQPKALKRAIQEQIYLIGREALLNALRHSEGTTIEAEIEYLPRQLRVSIRDNGRGMDPEVVTAGRSAHWGLVGMRERAENIGAQFRIWSRLGAGTEVEISVPGPVLTKAYA